MRCGSYTNHSALPQLIRCSLSLSVSSTPAPRSPSRSHVTFCMTPTSKLFPRPPCRKAVRTDPLLTLHGALRHTTCRHRADSSRRGGLRADSSRRGGLQVKSASGASRRTRCRCPSNTTRSQCGSTHHRRYDGTLEKVTVDGTVCFHQRWDSMPCYDGAPGKSDGCCVPVTRPYPTEPLLSRIAALPSGSGSCAEQRGHREDHLI